VRFKLLNGRKLYSNSLEIEEARQEDMLDIIIGCTKSLEYFP
jgi:hypothetical protein